ncbi:MAG: hypothetical protein KDK69_03845 [Chlamydiia bacterium]|nr:hypothetical protein [Chlamydiia bacterium]
MSTITAASINQTTAVNQENNSQIPQNIQNDLQEIESRLEQLQKNPNEAQDPVFEAVMRQSLQRLLDDYSNLSPEQKGNVHLTAVMDDLNQGLGLIQEGSQGLEVDPALNDNLGYISTQYKDFINNILIPDINACSSSPVSRR